MCFAVVVARESVERRGWTRVAAWLTQSSSKSGPPPPVQAISATKPLPCPAPPASRVHHPKAFAPTSSPFTSRLLPPAPASSHPNPLNQVSSTDRVEQTPPGIPQYTNPQPSPTPSSARHPPHLARPPARPPTFYDTNTNTKKNAINTANTLAYSHRLLDTEW